MYLKRLAIFSAVAAALNAQAQDNRYDPNKYLIQDSPTTTQGQARRSGAAQYDGMHAPPPSGGQDSAREQRGQRESFRNTPPAGAAGSNSPASPVTRPRPDSPGTMTGETRGLPGRRGDEGGSYVTPGSVTTGSSRDPAYSPYVVPGSTMSGSSPNGKSVIGPSTAGPSVNRVPGTTQLDTRVPQPQQPRDGSAGVQQPRPGTQGASAVERLHGTGGGTGGSGRDTRGAGDVRGSGFGAQEARMGGRGTGAQDPRGTSTGTGTGTQDPRVGGVGIGSQDRRTGGTGGQDARGGGTNSQDNRGPFGDVGGTGRSGQDSRSGGGSTQGNRGSGDTHGGSSQGARGPEVPGGRGGSGQDARGTGTGSSSQGERGTGGGGSTQRERSAGSSGGSSSTREQQDRERARSERERQERHEKDSGKQQENTKSADKGGSDGKSGSGEQKSKDHSEKSSGKQAHARPGPGDGAGETTRNTGPRVKVGGLTTNPAPDQAGTGGGGKPVAKGPRGPGGYPTHEGNGRERPNTMQRMDITSQPGVDTPNTGTPPPIPKGGGVR